MTARKPTIHAPLHSQGETSCCSCFGPCVRPRLLAEAARGGGRAGGHADHGFVPSTTRHTQDHRAREG